MSREIELKILLDAAGVKRLNATSAIKEFLPEKQSVMSLHSIYFDTLDRRLQHAGIALRVRKEGRRWVQTVKIGTGVIAGLSMPQEAESSASGGRMSLDAIPDSDMRDAVRNALGDQTPAPVFETAIRRILHRLRTPAGGVVELAIDVGEIRANGRVEPICEAELELKAGDPADIYAVARALFDKGPLRLSRRSKAQRGYAVADGGPAVAPLPAPVTAAPVKLRPAQTTESAARDVLRGCLNQIAGNVAAAALSDAPEGPHQLRIGLRRLRTAAKVFGKVLGGPALAEIEARAQTLATAVGAVRDLDVLGGEVLAPLAGLDPGFAPLAAAVSGRRDAARKTARARLAHPDTSALIFDLGAFIEARGWLRPADFDQTAALAQPVIRTASAALAKRWRKVEELGERIDMLEGDARHELRKALKKLRYTVEFFESLWPDRKINPWLKALKALQDDFGALQDVAMAQASLLGPQAIARDDPDAQRAVGMALGRCGALAEIRWAATKDDWRKLSRESRFWR
jgi:inorganic triphosphatase YgiF